MDMFSHMKGENGFLFSHLADTGILQNTKLEMENKSSSGWFQILQTPWKDLPIPLFFAHVKDIL